MKNPNFDALKNSNEKNAEQISSCTENVNEVPIPAIRLEVVGFINNKETPFILDSGATISVINIKQVQIKNAFIDTKNVRVHTANGSILKVEGKMDINILFHNLIFPIQFVLVSNLAGPALLGTDFLSKYRVQLDFFNKEIVMYKNINNKVKFKIGAKNDILNSCEIVDDSFKQHKESTETKENKIKVNTRNTKVNNSILNEQNDNIILLEKLAKQVHDPYEEWGDYNKNIKEKHFEINNVTLCETDKIVNSNKINDTYETLNKSITALASKFVKLENVPSDGNCGIHTLVKILNNEQINVNFKQITDLLKLTKYKMPIWLEAEDLAAVTNHYNLNLIVIQETPTSDNNFTALAYYKPGRKYVSVFYNLNHWTPGVLSNEINTTVINSIVVYDLPSLKSRHSILQSRYKCNDILGGENIYNISNNADIMHNNNRPIVNSKKLEKISPDITCEHFDINPDLTTQQKGELIQLLNKYKNIFSQSKWDLGEVDTEPIEIKLTDNTPVNLRNFKLSLSEIKEIEKQTKELLEAGIIEHSLSPYSSPVFLVPKGQPQGTKNKTASEYRMVLDYRRVNEKTHKEAFPLPIIQNIYDTLAGNKYFSCLDAMSGFHQLKLHENSKEITSFSTSTGHYQFTRLPFGLTNAPQKFQKVINKIMAGLNYRINCCYLDDCVCFGKTFEEHLNALEMTFERLLKYRLKLKVSKCKFGYTELKLLGNIINGHGIKPTQEGLLAIKQFPSPTTIKQLRSFLGLANYFRKFIPNFSKVAHPLTELTKGTFKTKKSPINWTNLHETAFKDLKDKLTNEPVLAHFDDNAEIILVTDGSKKGLGAILQQQNENKEIHPVSYASKKLNSAQNNYSALELEMAALYFGCTHFRQYLHGRHFIVWTDHKNLIQLQTIKSESIILNRLRTKLIGFDFKIIYKKGIFNQAADFLSRYPIITPQTNYGNDSEISVNLVKPTLKLDNIVEYKAFLEKNSTEDIFNFNFKEIECDLFDDFFNNTYHLVHCVSEDLTMNKGIALKFKQKYGKINKLKTQKKGDILFLKFKNQYIIYLITKTKYHEKPTYEMLFEILKKLKEFCITHKLNNLAMPRIACGLDKLNWRIISNMIKFIFNDTDIKISVAIHDPNTNIVSLIEPVNIKILQAQDNYLKNIITALENPELIDIKWQKNAKSYILHNKNGLIYYKQIIKGVPKLVLAIPIVLSKEVIKHFHDNKMSGAHLGVHKVYNKIRTRYHWPLMHKQIKAYVTSCIHCQKRKPDKSAQVGKMRTYPVESGIPFSDVTIDYVGPLMISRGFKYILVATCRVTKYCVAKACRNADAKTTTAFLLDLILSYGAMKVVRSDNGTHFTAKVISDMLTILNIKKTEGIAYRPTSQGGVEKQNQVIVDMIAPYMQDNEKWSDVLKIVLHAYNSAIHYSTGYSPFYLLHGYEPSSIFDIAVIPNSLEHSVIEELNKLQRVRDTIPEILKKAFENQKINIDKNKSDIDFKVGEQVLVKIPVRKHKFSDRYDGPYPIIKKLNTNSYLIKLPKNGKLVDVPIHVQQIKKFIDKRHPTHSTYYYS